MSERFSSSSFIEVNLEAVKHNAGAMREFLVEGTKQMAVVKADAYGHGAVEVAKALEGSIDWFAVYSEEEGVRLRESGIKTPILVFGTPTAATASAYREHRLTATVSASEHFDLLPDGTEYHINFDTGMGRLGFTPDRVSSVKKAVRKHPDITCTGIYSHLSTAEDPGSSIAEEQLEIFDSIREEFDDSLLAHIANTGATAFYPESHYDMVRNGIGIYGYAPGATIIDQLVPALRWVSELAQVKPVKKGQPVSYGARWRCREDGYLGILPVGYQDGIPRILSGYLEIAIDGKLLPVVGTITMNNIMVYLQQNPEEFEAGQKVEIMGGAALSASIWSDRADTIPYEILTGIPAGIERRYIDRQVESHTEPEIY